MDHEWFDGERDAVVQRALAAGVAPMVTIGADVRVQRGGGAAGGNVSVRVRDGRHSSPRRVDRRRRRVPAPAELAEHPKVVAVGEIGLDYYYDHSPRDVQRDVFVRQLQLARRTGLPFVMHNRDASDDVMAVLREHGRGLPGLLHSFTGSAAMARSVWKWATTFPWAGWSRLKTRAPSGRPSATCRWSASCWRPTRPYLTPVPLRGRRNEPAYVRHVAEFLAAERGLDVAEVARVTTANARRFFRLGGPFRAPSGARTRPAAEAAVGYSGEL